jgi:hypothetical protein
MTGDFIQLNDCEYGILITPECDIYKVNNNPDLYFDLLHVSPSSIDETINKHPFKISASKVKKEIKSELSKDEIRKVINHIEDQTISRAFSQEQSRYHFLPSFPCFSPDYNKCAVVDFTRHSFKLKSSELKKLVEKYPREIKLNSPFIQQLRQRYLAHVGRIGVPALPSLVRNFQSLT